MSLIPTLVVALAGLQGSSKLVQIDTVLGSGPAAAKGDVVTVAYRGSLQTGTVFDETKGKGPFVFDLGAGMVIKGWDEGVVGMQKGGKRMLQIPADMAYGDKAVGPIPAKSTLIFEVEMLRIQKKDYKPMIEIEEIKAGEGA